LLCALAFSLCASHSSARVATSSLALRWTDETPERMVDDAVARAQSPKAGPAQRLASTAVVAKLADRAQEGYARAALERLADDATLTEDVRRQAALLSQTVDPRRDDAGLRAGAKLGVVQALAVLGPFRDTGGGLAAHDGPEASGSTFADTRARYSWGSYEVAWRAVPRDFAAADGVPLDLFVSPRRESCTWVATKLAVPEKQKLVVALASTGQVRLVFDGVEVGRDAAVHESLRFDRIAARVVAEPGAHLLAAKVCSGALDDDGEVRLRVTDEHGAWPTGVTASADLSGSPSAGAHPPKLSFELVTPPLAKALAQSPASQDDQLAVAALRTIGGADDLRSPRAPGLLAALADGPLDADALAMAAWLSPNAASRGAWLNRARSASGADPRSAAFVDRRLVERHLDAGLADWAMASLRGAKLDTAADPEASLIASRVEVALGTEALRMHAMHRLAAVAHALPNAPRDVLALLAEVAVPYDPALAWATRDKLAARGELGSGWVAACVERGRAIAVAAAQHAFAGGIESADDGLAVAQAVARSGAHDEARALYEQLSRWAPNRAGVWAGLARETSAAQNDATMQAAIAAALRRSRELDPGEARTRAELSLRVKAPPSDEPRDDERYLVTSSTILARRQGLPNAERGGAESGPPDVANRELHWLRAVVMHADRRVSELVHYAREIVIAPRTEDELFEDIPAEGDLTEIVRARVHRKEGGSAFPVEQMSDNGRPRIRWPELAPGDVVEVAFRSWTAGPVGGRGDPPFYRLDYAGSLSTRPVLYNEVDIESPADRPIYVGVVHGGPERREEHDDGGRHVVRLVWDKPANVPDEPLAPPLSEIIPTVVLSTFKDWNAFREWYGEAVRGFTEPDAQVRALASKLTQGKASRDAKVRALFDFVADDIRYVNYVSGEWWLPNRPQQLLARREGDCDDKALLLITLLKAAGIDAQEVLVQTRLTGEPSVLRAPGSAAPLFDHGIAFLPGQGKGTYLDATSPQSRLGPLPSMDARAVALRMDGPAEIVQLPSSSPDDHGLDSTWTVALAADGGAGLDGQENATGDDAFWMRTYLTEQGARAPWVEQHLVSPWLSTVEVEKKVDFRGDLARGAAWVRWRAHARSLARREGDELVVPLAPSQTLASQLAPLVTRTLPVWLPAHVAPRRESRTIHLTAPPGWAFEALPSGGDEDGGAFGRAHLDVAREPGGVVVHRSLVFDRSTIEVDEYAAWRAWVQRADALMHRSVRLAPQARGVR
jgi:hypothetical protein